MTPKPAVTPGERAGCAAKPERPGADAWVPASTAARADTPAVESEALLRGQRAISISHNGEIYRLQATRLGKLILTK